MPEKLLSFGIGKANAMSEGYTLFTVLIGTCSRTELQNGNPDSGSAYRLDLKIAYFLTSHFIKLPFGFFSF